MPARISREELLSELHRLTDMLGETPTVSDMKEQGEYSERPYTDRFGSWNEALEVADLSLNKQQNISRGALLDELRQLADDVDRSPRISDMNDHGQYSSQVYMKRFDSWNEALNDAGLTPNQPEKADKDSLMEELKRLSSDLGRTPKIEHMNEKGKFSVRPYRRAFGSWDSAIQAAGLTPNKPSGDASNLPDYGPRPSREELESSLRKLSNDLGRTPTREEVVDRTEYTSGDFERTFGTFTNACKAVGLSPNRHTNIDRDDLIQEIERLKDEIKATPRLKDLKERGKYSQQPYQRIFGGWINALEAAGIEPNQRRNPPENELKSKLRTLADNLGRTPTRGEVAQETSFTRQHYETAFGSYREACRAAGLKPNNPQVGDEELIEELKILQDKLGHTPRQHDVREIGEYASSTYRSEFGSWNEALEAAGMDPNQRKDFTREELVQELQRLHSELDRVPLQADVRKYSEYSVRPFYTEFGGISLAVEAAGMEPSWNKLSRDMLINELERLEDEVERVPFVSDMKDRGRWGIMPYYREFGSWKEALEAAGFELPDRPHFTSGNYGAGWNESTKSRIRERDGKKCVDCEMNQATHLDRYGRRLHVHHITPASVLEDPERRNAEKNLISLCISCHAKWDRVRGTRRAPESVDLPEYVSPPDPK